MKVVIAGGGIGGLACALFLHAAGIEDITIFEAVQDIRELGVGINIQPHAVRELERIGLLEQLVRKGNSCTQWSMYNKFGQHIWSEPRGTAAGHHWPQVSINRGRLHGLLLAATRSRLRRQALCEGWRVLGYDAAADGRVSVAVQSADGRRSAEADLLVAADGIHSAIRAQAYPCEGEPCYGGQVLWRGVSTDVPFLDGHTMIFAGTPHQKLIAYPISQRDVDGRAQLNWIAEVAGKMLHREDWNRPGRPEDFLPLYRDWKFPWLDVPELIRRAPVVYEFPMVDRDPLPQWTFGRVTLLGDAAHPMYPIGANGASQAIRDGAALADALCAAGSIDDGLAAYEAHRRPETTAIVYDNRKLGPEVALKLADERAPGGFTSIQDVISEAELAEISSHYRAISWGSGADADSSSS